MNTAIFSPSGGSVGIGFAISSDMIRTVRTSWSRPACHRGYVGVGTQAVTGPMAKALHLPESSGALLASVENNSPARKQGSNPAM